MCIFLYCDDDKSCDVFLEELGMERNQTPGTFPDTSARLSSAPISGGDADCGGGGVVVAVVVQIHLQPHSLTASDSLTLTMLIIFSCWSTRPFSTRKGFRIRYQSSNKNV